MSKLQVWKFTQVYCYIFLLFMRHNLHKLQLNHILRHDDDVGTSPQETLRNSLSYYVSLIAL